MSRVKEFEKLARELNDMPSKVDASLWANISSQIGVAGAAAGSAASTGFSLTKWIITAIVGTGLTTAVVLFVVNNKEAKVGANVQAKQGEILSVEKVKIDENTKQLQTEVIKEKAVVFKENNFVNEQIKKTEKVVVSTPPKEKPIQSLAIVPQEKKESQEPLLEKKLDAVPANQIKKTVMEEVPNLKKDEGSSVATEVKELPEIKQEVPIVQSNISRLPNAFTPNGDGSNDMFYIESEGLEDFSLVVLNTNQQVVWKTDNPNAKWNGIGMSGERVPAGQYMYFIAARNSQGKAVTKTQMLSIRY